MKGISKKEIEVISWLELEKKRFFTRKDIRKFFKNEHEMSVYLNILKNKIDLILTDIEMPKLNGFQLTEAIRNINKYKKLPIIALTSLTEEAAKNKAFQSGVDAYLTKLERETVLNNVGYYLENGHSE